MGIYTTAHPPTLCYHQDLYEASWVEKAHSQLSPPPERSLDQVGYHGGRANHCWARCRAEGAGEDRVGGIRVGLVELGTCNPSSVREPTVSEGQGSKSQAQEKVEREDLLGQEVAVQFAATLELTSHLPKPSLEARICLQWHPELGKSC